MEVIEVNQNTPHKIKPLPLPASILYFGIPLMVAGLIVYVVMPWLNQQGLAFFNNYIVVYATLPMLLMLTAAVVAVRREGHAGAWESFKSRMRLGKMGGKAWLWTIGLALFMIITAGMLGTTRSWIADKTGLAPPTYWPDELQLDAPGAAGGAQLPTEFLGIELAGNGWVIMVVLLSLIIATLGEELWWRGYILPRQELSHGKMTWVYHGILWTLFHAFMPWGLISILPGSLALAYVAQKQQNTWPGIIAHASANGLLVLFLLMGVLAA
jgi:membrane protease YdiL (CAAX protease family)